MSRAFKWAGIGAVALIVGLLLFLYGVALWITYSGGVFDNSSPLGGHVVRAFEDL